MPDSSGLGKPLSRTLLLSGWGQPDRPTSHLTIRHRSLACLHTRSLSQSYTFESCSNSLNSDNTRNYINSRTILVNLNTITKRLYLILKTRLLSSRIHARLTNPHPPLPPQEATTRQAAVSYDDNVRLLCNPIPLSLACFAYNTQSPATISEYIHTIVWSLHNKYTDTCLQQHEQNIIIVSSEYHKYVSIKSEWLSMWMDHSCARTTNISRWLDLFHLL